MKPTIDSPNSAHEGAIHRDAAHEGAIHRDAAHGGAIHRDAAHGANLSTADGKARDESATSEQSIQEFGKDTDLTKGPVLLYDGECGVCTRSIQWILRHEQNHTLRFAALQSPVGKYLLHSAKLPVHLDSLIWVQQGTDEPQTRIWSGAVIEALRYVGGPWSTLALMRFVPRPLRDLGYRLFARHRLSFAPQACLVPTPQTRARFLES